MLEATLSTREDIDEILRLYERATALMKRKGQAAWPVFERELVQAHIDDQRQFKFVVDCEIACVWSVTYSDPQIWGVRNAEPAVYIHRIATNPDFSGKRFVASIARWATEHARDRGLRFVRMDTAGENQGLIAHYQRCGFNFLGLSQIADSSGLPEHYRNATVSLFQLDLDS